MIPRPIRLVLASYRDSLIVAGLGMARFAQIGLALFRSYQRRRQVARAGEVHKAPWP